MHLFLSFKQKKQDLNPAFILTSVFLGLNSLYAATLGKARFAAGD